MQNTLNGSVYEKNLDQISLETDYCNFSISSNDDNMVLNLKVDIETAKKLFELKKILTDICYNIYKISRNNTIVKICTGEEIHIYDSVLNAKMKGNDDEICEGMTLKVHLKNTNSDKNNKLKKILMNIDPKKSKIKVLCSGYFWTNKIRTNGGVKFFVDNIKYKTEYNKI